MPYTERYGIRLWWEEAGSGPPIVLLHGYTSNLRTHWRASGWIDHLAERNRVIAIDQRGHGRSSKPRSLDAYSRTQMAADIAAVVDDAVAPLATLFGYSMGAIVGVQALLDYPTRFAAAILGGMGAEWEADGHRECRAEEPLHPPRPFRDLQRSARGAVAWVRHYNPVAMRTLARGIFLDQGPMPVDRLPEIEVPVLAVVGTRDRFCAGTTLLPRLIPDCRRVVLSGQTHRSAVNDPRFRIAVDQFLTEVRAGV